MDESPGGGGDAGGAAPSSSLRYGQVLQGVSALVAPATLLTGIAFYFGWQRVKAFDGYFGLEPSAVGYSTRDYVLNSLDALFLPVIVVLLALMALAFVHAYLGNVHRAGERPQALRRLAQLGLTGGVLLLLVGGIGAFGAFPFHTPYLVATLFPAGGVLLIAHAVDLRSRLRGAPPLSLGGRVLVGLFVAVCLFWAAGLYAETVGRDQAARLARHLDELPGVTISSTADLGLPTGSARAATSSGTSTSSAQEAAGGTTVHVYGGLRLLAQAGGTLFLLPGSWTAKRGTLFAVSQSDGMRIALTPAIVRHSGSLVSAGPNNESVVEATGPAPGYLRPVSRRVGPLVVRVVGRVTGSKVNLLNPTNRAVGGVSVAGRLANGARPLVSGSAASCRVAAARFTCRVDVIPPRGRRVLRLEFRGRSRSAHGRLTVGVGTTRRLVRVQLSR